MVFVELFETDDGFTANFFGHADFAKGNQPDILCASLSTLCYTLVGGAMTLRGAQVVFEDTPGAAHIDVKGVRGWAQKQKLKGLIHGVLWMAKRLETQYPSHVRVMTEISIKQT